MPEFLSTEDLSLEDLDDLRQPSRQTLAEAVRARFDQTQASPPPRATSGPSADPLSGVDGLSEKLDLRISPGEKAAWHGHADELGVSVSELIRATVNDRIAASVPS